MPFNSSGTGPLIFPVEATNVGSFAASPHTLTQDLIVGDLVLSNQIINTNGYKIFCKNLTMIGSSIIRNNGSDGENVGVGGAGGKGVVGSAGGVSGTITGSGSVGGGGSGGLGLHGSLTSPTSFFVGSLGGEGGDGGAGVFAAGGVGGAAVFTAGDVIANLGANPLQSSIFQKGCATGISLSTTVMVAVYSDGGNKVNWFPYVLDIPVVGGAGGGYGGLSANISGRFGGGGGGGGGIVLICCSGNISIFDGTIEANGGDGYNGDTADAGAGGGGGGGAIIITCNSLIRTDNSAVGMFALGGASGSVRPGEVGSSGHILIMTPERTGMWTGSINSTALQVFPNLVSDNYVPQA